MKNELLSNILIGLIAGLISGIVSSAIVYLITKKKEKNEHLFAFWHDYIFSAMEKCDINFPEFEALTSLKVIGNKNSKWYNAIMEIQDQLHPEAHIDKVFSEREEIIAKNALVALEELNKWKNGKRVSKRR